MLKTFKYRLLPTEPQARLINEHIGACRLVYNLALDVKSYAYSSHGKSLSGFDLIAQLPSLKDEFIWLKEIDSQALQQSILNLNEAFSLFFKGCSAFPKFKKKNSTQSFRHPHGSRIRIEAGKLYQPKFKDGVRVVIDREPVGQIKSTTISKTQTGKYFVSVLIDTKKPIPALKLVNEHSSLGIDLGINHFAALSNGHKVDNPKRLQAAMHRLRFLDKQVSKKQKGGANRKKAKLKLSLHYEKVCDQRKDFLHKLSTQLVKSHDTLCFEDLRIENLRKNRSLSRAISDAGWGMFVDMCKYKAAWSGKNILQLSPFEPSTKPCSVCGSVNASLTLKDREWTCANCGAFHDRDINAAINIKNIALKNCGGVHREKPVEPPTLVGAEKQELISNTMPWSVGLARQSELKQEFIITKR